MNGALIVQGNALALPLPDASVDLVVTSPPYFALRAYGAGPGEIGVEPTTAEYLDALLAATREMIRVLKPEGSIFVNLGDKYGRGTRTTVSGSNSKNGYADPGRVVPTGNPKALLLLPERYRIACADQLGLIPRAVAIWHKVNGLPESATDRIWRRHEDWVHLVRQPNYYSADPAELGELRQSSVWPVSSEPLDLPAALEVEHYAPFPSELPRRIILGWSALGHHVLDPFGGTGTTAMVARVLDRVGISVDLSAHFCRGARWRVLNDGDRAIARTNLERQETLL